MERRARAICSIARNESRYLFEWIAYHRLIGIDKFYIYDNESNDGMSEILDALESASIVSRIPWITPSSGSPQLSAYQDFLVYNSNMSEFVAFIDLDEFISIPDESATLGEYFSKNGLFADDVGAVAINQRVFGSGGQIVYDARPVVERFTKAATEEYEENTWFKPIVRPCCIRAPRTSHYFELSHGRYADCAGATLDMSVASKGRLDYVRLGLRLNHYIVKSLAEFREKQSRGGVSGATKEVRAARYDDAFFFGREPVLNVADWSFEPNLLSSLGFQISWLANLVSERLPERRQYDDR